jgi:beta-phosphoglucomutase
VSGRPRPRGFIFDVDGTIVDNMAYHQRAFDTFLERHDLPPLSREMRARTDGQRNRDIFPLLFQRPLSEEEIRRFIDEKEGGYRELSRGRLQPLPGFVRLLDVLEGRRLPAALATSAPAENVEHTLAELGLRGRLTRVARSDQVPHGKPHPDVFLAAAGLIDVPPSECVAFEDAPMGILAARAAGMTCVALTTNFSPEALAAHGASPDVAVPDFDAYLAGPGAWLLATG